MGDLTPYQFEGHSLRIVPRDGEPWFVATDAALMLGYAEAKDLTRTLDDDEKGRHEVPTLGGDQKVWIISEAGLYRVIVQRRASDTVPIETRERIARFQRWAFHDVLPSIRKTGHYEIPSERPVKPTPVLGASTREARLLHQHFLTLGKLAGLRGNQLLIAANRATKAEIGFDPLGSMAITLIAPVNDPLVIPTKLGQDLGGLHPTKVNRLLALHGFQTKDRDHRGDVLWRPTDKGVAAGAQLTDVERNNDTGADQQLKWPISMVDILRDLMDQHPSN